MRTAGTTCPGEELPEGYHPQRQRILLRAEQVERIDQDAYRTDYHVYFRTGKPSRLQREDQALFRDAGLRSGASAFRVGSRGLVCRAEEPRS